MPSQPENSSAELLAYEYALIRFLPCAERGEFVNVGLVMMCKRRKWVRAAIHADAARILALFPEADIGLLKRQLESFRQIASGKSEVIGSLEPHERFRWLTAVRSASVQTSRPHPGLTADPDATFERLLAELVM